MSANAFSKAALRHTQSDPEHLGRNGGLPIRQLREIFVLGDDNLAFFLGIFPDDLVASGIQSDIQDMLAFKVIRRQEPRQR